MATNEAVKKFVEDWVQQRCPSLQCAGCGSRQWVSNGALLVSIGVKGHVPGEPVNVDLGGPDARAVPLAPVFCRGCGHVVFFSAKAMGLSKN